MPERRGACYKMMVPSSDADLLPAYKNLPAPSFLPIALERTASKTERLPSSRLAALTTLANADIRFSDTQGKPIFATRSTANGSVSAHAMIDVPVGTKIVMTAFDGEESESRVLKALEA